MKRLAFLSDIHFGECQDLRAYGFAVKILEEIQPDSIVLAGDIFDHGAVGKYRKNPEKTVCLQDEINTGIKQLEKLVDACPTTYISMFTGNHESRLPHYLLDISKALYGLECFNPRKLYGLDDLGIEYIEKTPYKVGHLYLAHGDEFNTSGINPAAKALDDVNSSVAFGHVHKFSEAGKTQLNGRQIGAWSNGCLCTLSPEYTLQPNWQQGFTLVDFTARGYFSVSQVRFWYDRKLRALQSVVDGQLFDSREGK